MALARPWRDPQPAPDGRGPTGEEGWGFIKVQAAAEALGFW